MSILVTRPSRISFAKQDVADVCAELGSELKLKRTDVDGALLLFALAGKESSWGANCTPRHEMGYCVGQYSKSPLIVELTAKLGCAAHASYGPWQIMLCNAVPLVTGSEVESFGDLRYSAKKTVDFINRAIIQAQGAKTVDQIADAYNSGNFRDRNVPTAYIEGVKKLYAAGLPSATVVA